MRTKLRYLLLPFCLIVASSTITTISAQTYSSLRQMLQLPSVSAHDSLVNTNITHIVEPLLIDRADFDSLLSVNNRTYRTLPSVSYGTPAVFDTYHYLDTLSLEQQSDANTQFGNAYQWLNDIDFSQRLLSQTRQRYMIDNPEYVRYNLSQLPEPPKMYRAFVDPTTTRIVLEELKVDGKDLASSLSADIERKKWLHTFDASLQFSQAYISPNWYQGGNNNLNMIGQLVYNVKLNPKYYPNLLFETTVQYKLALNSAPDDSIHSINITEDVFQVNSTLGVKAAKRWYYSASLMFKTQFFNHYAKGNSNHHTLLDAYKAEGKRLYNELPEIPFGNIWMAKQIAPKLPANSVIHLGILNTLRSWNFFDLPANVESFCNVGGFGIDGCVSTLIGASLANKDRLHFGVFGDLALFYDMNVLGNRHVGNNVRILLINNGCGTEFRNYNHPANRFGDDADPYMAAAGHFGNKSKNLMRHVAEDLGYEYLCCSNKEDFSVAIERFLTPELTERPMLMEAFTNSNDESNALEKVMSFNVSYEDMMKDKAKDIVKTVVGDKGLRTMKKLLGK